MTDEGFQRGHPACEAPAGDDHTGCADQANKDACEVADSAALDEKCEWLPRRPRVFGDVQEVDGQLFEWVSSQERAAAEAEGFVADALAGLDPTRLIDGHVHLLGLGSGGRLWSNPGWSDPWKPWQSFQYEIYLGAGVLEAALQVADQVVKHGLFHARRFSLHQFLDGFQHGRAKIVKVVLQGNGIHGVSG